jgi:transcriptional regulator with XRE-family HTH domain
MTPQTFRAIRLRAGLSYNQLADKLRVSYRTVYRYEGGDTAIPGLTEDYMLKLESENDHD